MFTPKALNKQGRSSLLTSSKRSTPNRHGTSSFVQQQKLHGLNRANQSLNRSQQTSQFLDETTLRLETYGGALPVVVTEALAFADRQAPPSIKLDPSGWAKLVVGRKLLIWKYKPSAVAKVSSSFELSLPSSQEKQHVDLVTLFSPRADAPPACIAATAEGIIRFWHSITHESSYCDVTADVKGDPCRLAIAIKVADQEYQCVIATECSSLVIVTPITQNKIKCHTVKPAEGALSGVRRRMSSFIFGSAVQKPMIAKLHSLAAGEELDEGASFYVLCGSNLQKWIMFDDEEKMLYDNNIEQFLADSISRQVWNQDSIHLPKLRVWLLDLQTTKDAVVVLGAAYNPDVSDQVYYALGNLHTEGKEPPRSFLSFAVPQYTSNYDEDELALRMRLLLPDAGSSSVFLFEPRRVIITSVTDDSMNPDKIDFNSPGDKLLGSGYCDKTALFFSNTHGLVAIQDSAVQAEQSIRNQSMMAPDLSVSMKIDEHPSLMLSPARLEEMAMSDDGMQRLKSAFLQFLRNNTHDSQLTVENLFPIGDQLSSAPDSSLNTLVVGLSREMIDDVPAQDPRWAEAVPQDGGGSSSSLIVLHQLEDKLRAHDLFINFLRTMALLDRLTSVTRRGRLFPTGLLLCEHAEKLVAAKHLRQLHIQHTEVVDAVVALVLRARGTTSFPAGLTQNDVFYREVSRIDEIVERFVEFEKQFLSVSRPSAEIIRLVETTTSIIYGMLFEAHQYRDTAQSLFRSDVELQPWTTALREPLCSQHQLVVSAVGEAQDAPERGRLLRQLFELSDLILDGFRVQLDSIRRHLGENERFADVRTRYTTCRAELIQPFMELEQWERAAALAEKYCDFRVLVELCEVTENQERLQRYMNQFQHLGFSDFVFRWYVEEGKRGKLLASASLASHPQLSGFLQSADNQFMSWLHDIRAGDFYRAHDTLQHLGKQEKQFLSRKKTLLSLSKLAALAAENPPSDNIEDLNYELDIILHQENLPHKVIENLAMDAETMTVFPPHELIEVHVSNYNEEANEFDFKRALDLLHYVDQHEQQLNRQQLLTHIWAKAILRDDWSSIPTDDPLENIKHTLFYKTLELAHADEGVAMREVLPSAEELLNCEELADLGSNRNVQFLVRAQLEHYNRILA